AVFVDPSHAGGKAWMVGALSKAAVAAGADGLLIEIHPNPKDAWGDADQALTPAEFATLMGELRGGGAGDRPRFVVAPPPARGSGPGEGMRLPLPLAGKGRMKAARKIATCSRSE